MAENRLCLKALDNFFNLVEISSRAVVCVYGFWLIEIVAGVLLTAVTPLVQPSTVEPIILRPSVNKLELASVSISIVGLET